MKTDLKTTVNKHLQSKQLDDDKLNHLMNLVDVPKQRSSGKPQRYFIAASFILSLFAIALIIITTQDRSSGIAVSIAEEVAYNHLKMMPLEVSSDSLQDLRPYFSKLDFALVNSEFTSSDLELLGGRYCSIQGVTAAQLRLQDQKTGQLETLYQAPYDKKLFADLPNLQEGESPVRHYINGIAVDIWIEKGILFTRTASEQ